MNPEFIFIVPEKIKSLPFEVRKLIEETTRNDYLADFTGTEILADAVSGLGLLYLIHLESALIGYIYYIVTPNMTLNVAMMGGEGMSRYGAAIRDHAIHVAQLLKCEKILVLSRKAWGRIIPALKPIGVIYELNIPKVKMH